MAKMPEVKQDEQPETPPAPLQKPDIGRIVRYCLSEQDAAEINTARKKALADVRSKTSDRAVVPARVGNQVKAGDVVAMMIVAIHGTGNCVNGQLFLDGNDSHWVTSRSLGETVQPGSWGWPAR